MRPREIIFHLSRSLARAALVPVALAAIGGAGPAQAGLTFTVNSIANTGDYDLYNSVCADSLGNCTLRAAIEEANTSPELDTIQFSIGTGVQEINPTDSLPPIFHPLVIDGTTQPGFAGKPIIELDGSFAGQYTYGLYVVAGNTTIRGLVINGFGATGITLFGAGGNKIAGNFLGTNVAGTVAGGGGSNYIGVFIDRSDGNVVGGTSPADRNVISGNESAGVYLFDASNNEIQGNYIGTDVTGSVRLGNSGVGVGIQGNNNLVGGIVPGSGNLISGNGLDGGIFVYSGSGNTVQGNLIGTDASGTDPLFNAGPGVTIFPVGSGDNNTVGGESPAARNVISGNDGPGILVGNSQGNVIAGNFIGTDRTGTLEVGNGGDGIELVAGANNIIGGATPAERNVISGNYGNGLALHESASFGNVLRGNYIGTDVSGLSPLPNIVHGILISHSAGNSIAQGSPVTGNIIAFNYEDGVRVDGALATSNMIRANSIHSNFGNGIENASGGNGEIAVPTITSVNPAVGQSLPDCLIDLYSDSENEGRIYYGSAVADGSGSWSYEGPVGGPNLTATCTIAAATSEFSLPFVAGCAADDADCEGVTDVGDNCPHQANPGQEDADSDGVGDVCEPPSPDVDCNGIVNSVDALKVLRHTVGLFVQQTQPCEFIGQTMPGGKFQGDVNCNGSVNAIDALIILRMVAVLPVALPPECPPP